MRKFPSRHFFREVEMQAKKLLSCGFAFLLVLAFAGVSSALEVSKVRGTWVRIEKPAAGAYAAIGDTLIVAVHTVSAAELSSVAVQIVRKDGSDDGTDPDDVTGGNHTLTNSALTTADANREGGSTVTLPKADADVQATIVRFYFAVEVSDEDLQENGLFVKVTLSGDNAGQAAGVIYNTTKDKQILPGSTGFATTPVGDGKTFGIDNRRPVNGTAFERFILIDAEADTIAGIADTSSTKATRELTTIGEGEKVRVNLVLKTGGLIRAGADKATVIFVQDSLAMGDNNANVVAGTTATLNALQDSAIAKATVTFDNLYAKPLPLKSVNTAEGVFADGKRIMAFAFLQDEAGNLGATNANDASPSGVNSYQTRGSTETNDKILNLFMIDTTTPRVTVLYPKAGTTDSVHMSAKVTQKLEYYSDADGDSREVGHSKILRPLKLKVSEDVDSIKVTHAKLSATVNRTAANLNDTKEFSVDLSGTKIKYARKKGPASSEADSTTGSTKGKLTIVAYDKAGNGADSARVLADIFFDGNDPQIYSLFPTSDNAPKDDKNRRTITKATANPLFSISEDLDSLSVRYVQKGASPPDFVSQNFTSGPEVAYGGGSVRRVTLQDTFLDGRDYYLQIVAVDKAGNATVAPKEVQRDDQLRFKKEFMNPVADSFVVALPKDAKDTVWAGAGYTLNLSVLDKKQSKAEGADVKAVVYRGNSRLRVVVSDDQADRLKGVSFKGDNVSIAESDTGKGIATLGKDGWKAGARSITITSKMTLKGASVIVENLDSQGTATFSAMRTLNVDAAKFAAFKVEAMEDGETTKSVIGDFKLSVTPTDKHGNPSMKRTDRIDKDVDTDDFTNDDGLYKTIAIELSSSNPKVRVPQHEQDIDNGGAAFPAVGATTYDAIAEDASGMTTITVRSESPSAKGSVDVTFGPPAPPPAPGAPAAPANLIVQDNPNDHGSLVMVNFPNSADHATVDKYQIYREQEVNTGLDSLGNVVEMDSTTMAWVPWADLRLEDPNGDVQRAVIPALDNKATRWAVAAIGTGGSSDKTSSVNKRVFTKESVQQTLELLGIAPEAVLTHDELMNQFNAPEDYAKSIIGDRKDLVFVPVNPDVSVLLGNGSVPSNIRTSGHPKLASERTATEGPVAAVDNIAPAAATEGAGALGSNDEGAQVTLSWAASTDDGKIVGSIQYRGYVVPIMGLKGYRVLRGTAADALETIGTVDAGSSEFVDTNLPADAFTIKYRIDAFDDDNDAAGQLITIQNLAVRAKFADADDNPVYLMVLPSQGGTPEVDFEDFVEFAKAFGSRKGDANYNVQADVNDDGTVDFTDFTTAAVSYGRTAAGAALNKLVVVPQRPGVNADTEMRLELASEKVLVGETISVTVSMANARALNGYGLELVYDADKFEFVSAVPAEKDLLKSEGGETPLFKNWPEEGRVSVVNAIIESGSVSGEGALVTFTFKVLREFEDSARFEIAQGVVFDPERLSNPVVTLGALDVQSTPTEFALHQNYPNPFNPQTNIPYDLAEGGDVVLRIYNLLGQEVRTLVRERQAPGRYTVQWSGMDDRGVSVSSGIYFYQVSVAGKFQDAKRLMLLK